MIDEADRYWGPAPGRTWAELPELMIRLRTGAMNSTAPALCRPARSSPGSDRIAPAEVAESNALMERLGLRTRYLATGEPYLIDEPISETEK